MTEHNEMSLVKDIIKPMPASNIEIKVKKMKKQKVKKRTLDEFKNWLDGMAEFQDEDWTPNLEQWNHIKDSINAIRVEQIRHGHVEKPAPIYNHVTPPIRQNPVLDLPKFNLNVSGLPSSVDMRDPSKVNRDIDTSNGQYISDFE